MKKIFYVIVFGMLIITSFLMTNSFFSSNSYPGFGFNENCNYCHNQPTYVKPVDISFAMNDFTAAENAFVQNAQWSTNWVPVIQTNNRSSDNLEFIKMGFLKNSTHIMVEAQISDTTLTTKGSGSAISDKFGIIFNIDVDNFSVGDFLTYYNSSETNLNNVLTGQMMFSQGHADLWYVDVSNIGFNVSGKAMDYSISSGILSDGSTHQDVYVAVWYGIITHYNAGYKFYFVRSLHTTDPNDAQFSTDGTGIYYAIASWDQSSSIYHSSSFDQMIVVGNKISLGTVTITQVISDQNQTTQTVTQTTTQSLPTTKTQTETITETISAFTQQILSTTTSSFTIGFVFLGLIVAIPIISRFRGRKD